MPLRPQFQRLLPYIFIVGGALGLLASFILTIERIALLKDPQFVPSCNLNPLLSCTTVSGTPQAEVFGFPNMLIGLAAYPVLITVGVALLAGARFKLWFWRWLHTGTLGGMIFVLWLFSQSVYVIGALCIYCMVVWAVTWPIFWYTTLHAVQEKYMVVPKGLQAAAQWAMANHLFILACLYATAAFLIFLRFRDFFVGL